MDMIEENGWQLLSTLRARCSLLCAAFESSPMVRRFFRLEGDQLSPVKHLKLREKCKTIDEEWNTLFDIAELVSCVIRFRTV